MLYTAQSRIDEIAETWGYITEENFPFDELYRQLGPVVESIHSLFKEHGVTLPNLLPQRDDFFVCLFFPLFPGISETRLLRLVTAGILVRYTALALDYVFDEELDHDLTNSYTQYAFLLQGEALKLLQQLFPSESEFWPAYHETFARFLRANMVERSAATTQTWSEYEDLAQAKSALSELAIWGLSCLAEVDPPAALFTSMRNFAVGFQIYDDIRDMERDKVTQTRIVPWFDAVADGSLEQFASSGKLSRLLNHARGYCEQALLEAGSLSPSSGRWIRQIQMFIMRLDSLARDLEGLGVTRDYKVVSSREYEGSFQRGLAWVENQIESDFAELVHVMLSAGLPQSTAWQEGHVFPLSVLGNRLLDLRDRGVTVQPRILRRLTDRVLECRADEPFKYFPHMVELPPDIDDFAEVLQLLTRQVRLSDYPEWQSHVQDVHEARQGGLSTWIYDNRQETRERYATWVENVWGEGSDLEVECNFAYALWMVGEEAKAKKLAQDILHRLTSSTMNARWYTDCGYSEFCVTRLMKATGLLNDDLANRILHQCEELLVRGKREYNPLTLSFVMRAIQELSHIPNRISAQIDVLQDLLQSWQRPNGSWSAVPFIAMPMKLPDGRIRRLFYQSATITTGCVLSALWKG